MLRKDRPHSPLFDVGRRCCFLRYCEIESGAMPWPGVRPDSSLMALHYLLARSQPKSDAAVPRMITMRLLERLEYSSRIFWLKADPIVTN